MLCVGIDVGATKVAAGVVDTAKRGVLERRRVATARDGREVLRDCVRLAEELYGSEVERLGVAVCELVRRDGTIASAATVDWTAIDVSAAFSHLAPTVVESDVRAAAVAEARLGAGRDRESMLFVNVGSGISHTMVVEGRPLMGARGNAIVTGAPPVERWSSGLALAAAAGPSVEEVLADPASAGVVAEAATRLGQTLAVLVNALDPAVLVIGGGLGSVASYRGRVEEVTRSLIYAEETRGLDIVPAALGADAALIGATLVAAEA
ncbi:MAG: ROK family protein [Thermoleophilaceae bacterium]|nr:ROK family protein [Thermoleophilaceae bacterium]